MKLVCYIHPSAYPIVMAEAHHMQRTVSYHLARILEERNNKMTEADKRFFSELFKTINNQNDEKENTSKKS